jgi:hypothetical protein
VKPRESEIQSSICDYLALRKHFFWRQNTAGMYRDGRFFSLPKYSMRGVPDLIVVHIGRPYFLEVKRPGSKQSLDQIEFQRQAEKAGALYAVVRSIDEVQQLGL